MAVHPTKHAPVMPMQGIRVLDLGTFIAAPYAATILGEFGADVIKVEKPETGDPLRAFGTPSNGDDTLCWLSEARNKKSITLDLRCRQGAELLKRLVRKSDVVCESFRPGTLEKWGLGYDDLIKENSRLIMLRVSGYGQTGPLKGRPSFARIAHAFAGLSHLTGMKDGPPLTPGSTSLADYLTGLNGAIGVLMALRVREKVGGQFIDLALYESIFRILDDMAPTYAQDGTVRGRLGLGTENACPHGHFKTVDERWVSLACTSDKIFERLTRVMDQPGLSAPEAYQTVAQRLADRRAVDLIVSTWIGENTAPEIVAICNEGGVPCAPINTISDIFEHPHIAERENLISTKTGEGDDCVIPNVIPKLSQTPGVIQHLGPQLGDANDEIYQDILGLSRDDIDVLKENGVI